MITSCMVYIAPGFDPYENLAREQYLLEHLLPGQCILYLWQNQNTVVIGRNQNAWAECRVALLKEEGGKLARRLSGGGAVFHDFGNLNFTFLMRQEDYDVDKQLSVIQQACALSGIRAEKSGRNDIMADGRKFSGNAFYHSKGNSYHHGTLLIHADMDKLQRYLSPPKAKLEAKGVASVRSRVVNLQDLAPQLTVDTMKDFMVQAFEQIYGLAAKKLQLRTDAQGEIAALKKVNSSWGHLFGAPLPFTFQCEARFAWGGIRLDMDVKGGEIRGVKVYSDAMDWQLPAVVEKAFTGCRFSKDAMQTSLLSSLEENTICQDLCQMIQHQDI